ncbi:MAG: amidase family protein [Sphingomonas sp.]
MTRRSTWRSSASAIRRDGSAKAPPFQTDAPVTPAHRDALAAMRRLGVTLVEVEFPDLPYSALLRNADVEAAAIFEELTLSGQDARLIPPWGDKWKQVRFLSAVDYLQIERFRRQVMEVMDAMFERVDVIFSPTYATFQLVMIANFTGHPGLTLRCGFAEMGTRNLGWTPADPATPRRRVTCNVAMHGRLFEEGRLIALGRALETELDVWRERPPVG